MTNHTGGGTASGDSKAEFARAISEAGLRPPERIVADGHLHRFSSDGRRGDDAGWYVLHLGDVPTGAFGCWRADISRFWCARTRRDLSGTERHNVKLRIAESRRQRAAQLTKLQRECRERAAKKWARARPADSAHSYLVTKGVQAHHVRQDGESLVVPVRGADDTLYGLQFIDPGGRKRFLLGTAKRGAFYIIGEVGDVLVVAEGFATAASIREATGYSVAVAFDAGNLKPAAGTLRSRFPKAALVVAGDHDPSGVGQTKARKAAAAVSGRLAIPPEPGDFNDLARQRGPEAVCAALKAAERLEPEEESDEDTIRRLAAMSRFEYDRQRETEAERLDVRVGTLDHEVARVRRDRQAADEGAGQVVALSDPEPWPEPVDGAELLDALAETIARHVILPTGAVEAVALWVLHSHAHESAAISPILAVTSPTPECGKTTLLTLLDRLVPRPVSASNITAAALFRAVERWRPTLLVDEADTYLRDSDELRGVLNSGHARASAWVIRTVGDDHEPRMFPTWGPKAVALIGRLPATLMSRSIHVELRRLAPEETVDPLRRDRLQHLEPLRRKAWRWAQDHIEALAEADPQMPGTLRGRAADNWRPLIAIADLAGGEWPARARRAAEALVGSDVGETAGVMLLEDVRRVFEERGQDKIASVDLVDALGAMEDRPWPEWRNGRPITAPQLAKLLKPFGIAPRSLRLDDGRTGIKGYRLDSFRDAFTRYLPAAPATPLHSGQTAAPSVTEAATSGDSVADEDAHNPAGDRKCSGVADHNPSHRAVPQEPASAKNGADTEPEMWEVDL